MPNYSGKWSLPTVMQAVAQGNWPGVALTAEYVTPGSYSWIAPGFVSAVSVLVIGAGGGGGGGYSTGGQYAGGGGGGGGGLTYKNSLAVTPGSSYTVVVGEGGQDGFVQQSACGR
jgi:hypothetical protein